MRPVFLGRLAGIVFVAGIGLFAGNVLAATRSSPATSDTSLPPVLQQAANAGKLTVTRRFPTDAPHITGYVIEVKGRHHIVYGDHGYLIFGHMVSPKGRDLSESYDHKYLPQPDVGKVVHKLESGKHLIQQGPKNAPVLYVFADPNCIYCHRFYKQAEPLVKSGKLRIRWVMVGFLKPTSMGRAAAILSSDNPAGALVRNENGFNDSREEGAIKPMAKPPRALKAVIREHEKLMARAGGAGTPTLLYRTAKGKWKARTGVPPDGWLKKYVHGKH